MSRTIYSHHLLPLVEKPLLYVLRYTCFASPGANHDTKGRKVARRQGAKTSAVLRYSWDCKRVTNS